MCSFDREIEGALSWCVVYCAVGCCSAPPFYNGGHERRVRSFDREIGGRCRGASFIVLLAVALLPRLTTEATSVACVASIVRSGGVVVVRRLLCCWLLLCSPV